MAIINKKTYHKKRPFRDATLFLVICEGSKRESDYFDFFDRVTAQISVITIPSKEGRSSPTQLIINAKEAEVFHSDGGIYELWFVIDVDRWQKQIHELYQECQERNWFIAISNPCFEVWLYYHFKLQKPSRSLESCSQWKRQVPLVSKGGFNSDFHPQLINSANKNAKFNYESTGYLPKVGSTQVFLLGEKIYNLTKKAFYNL